MDHGQSTFGFPATPNGRCPARPSQPIRYDDAGSATGADRGGSLRALLVLALRGAGGPCFKTRAVWTSRRAIAKPHAWYRFVTCPDTVPVEGGKGLRGRCFSSPGAGTTGVSLGAWQAGLPDISVGRMK